MLVQGARRVGKSTLATEFARNEYAAHLVIDFSVAPNDVKAIFENYRHDLDAFFRYLFTYYGVVPVTRDTLIVFDEVQRFPIAREFVKHLVADGRYDYLETGSLISIKQNVADIVIPSEEDSLELNPLDFEEFCWAMGDDPLPDFISETFAGKGTEPVPEALHRRCSDRLREYMLVGGMPQAVVAFREQNSFAAADEAKRRIVKIHREDIAKFAGVNAAKVGAIYDALPGQLSKHEKKFTLASLGANARYREYDAAFFWLSDARMTNMCRSVTDQSVGLGLTAEDSRFKCYLSDTGLLVTRAFENGTVPIEDVYRDVLFGKLQLNEGMLVENLVAQQLVANGRPLYFYSSYDSHDASNRMEIDFLVVRPYDNAGLKARICPIEVKSTKGYRTKSLDKFKKKFGNRIGEQIVLHPGNVRIDGERLYLPLYMAICL